jgi:mRNA-degrading endonuclease YafQ of YafQ-DinJ toxin-antitoxin module
VIKIFWDQGFKQAYRKKVKDDAELKERFWNVAPVFLINPLNPRLRAHKLIGKLQGLWAFSVSFDFMVIFKFLSRTEVLLIDICEHDEVY